MPRAAQPATPGVTGEAPRLHILVVSGENGVNVLKSKTVARPVVEVRDAHEQPVTGALVTFASPTGGPGVVFASDLRIATAVTDQNGRASVPEVQPRNEGAFTYNVTAQYQNEVANAAIHQTNFLTSADARQQSAGQAVSGPSSDHRGMSSKTMWIIIGGAGAAAAGAAFGFAKGGSTHTTSTTSTTTIGPGGSVSVGAPH